MSILSVKGIQARNAALPSKHTDNHTKIMRQKAEKDRQWHDSKIKKGLYAFPLIILITYIVASSLNHYDIAAVLLSSGTHGVFEALFSYRFVHLTPGHSKI